MKIIHITIDKESGLDVRTICGAPYTLMANNALHIEKLSRLNTHWKDARLCKHCEKKSTLHVLALTELE